MTNEIFALHLDGKILSTNIWKEYSEKWGHYDGLYGWRAPKKIYLKMSHAKNAIKHLPEQIRDKVEIVRYVPEGY